MSAPLPFIASDGGFSRSGMTKKQAGGMCLARAICNVTGFEFKPVWEALANCNAITKRDQLLPMCDACQAESIGKRNLDHGAVIGTPLLRLMRDMGFALVDVPDDFHM